MRKKFDIILSWEESFARAVALGIIVRKPLKVWHLLIPFMFIFEFLRRRKESEIFVQNFLFTKKLALEAAFAIKEGEDRQSKLVEIENKLKDWLLSQKLFSLEIAQKLMPEVNLLIEHYSKLLEAEGGNYPSLVKNAYKTQDRFEGFLAQLTSAEKEIDRAVVKLLGEMKEIQETMLIKEEVIKEMRAKEVSKLF